MRESWLRLFQPRRPKHTNARHEKSRPAETVEQMHFTIDQEPAVIVANVSSLADSSLVESEPPLPVDMLTKATPIILQGNRETRGRVEVTARLVSGRKSPLHPTRSFSVHIPDDAAGGVASGRCPVFAIPHCAGRAATRRATQPVVESRACVAPQTTRR